MTVIAEAYVRLRPKSDGFKPEADAQLDRSKPSDVTVDVKADTGAAKARLDELRVSLSELRARVNTARVALDGDAKAQTALDRIDFSLRRLGVTTAKPNITLEGAERTKIQLDAIEARLRAVGATTARPNVSGGSGGGFLGGLTSGASGGSFGPKGALGNLALFLGPTAFPLAAGAAGLGAGLLTPTVAGGLGLGLFGAQAKASVTAVSKVEDQLQKLDQKIAQTSPTTTRTTTPASAAQIQAATDRLTAAQLRLAQVQTARTQNPASVASAQASVLSAQSSLAALQGRGGTTTVANKEYEKLVAQRAALLKQLSPAEKDAAEGIEKLEHGWKAFQKALEPQTFKALATGTDIATKGLNLMLPATKAVGNEVDVLAKRADTALSQPFWHDFFTKFLATEAPRAVDTLGTVVGNVITGFARLSEDFTPLGHRLEDDVTRWSAVFNLWTQGNGPERFVAVVERDGPIAARALEALAHGLGGFAAGIEPIGRIELQALTPALEFIGTIGKQNPGLITAVGVAYLTVAVGMKAVNAAGALTSVDGGVRKLNSLRTAVVGVSLAIGTVAVAQGTAHSGAGGAAASSLMGALSGLTIGLSVGGPLGAAVGGAIGLLVGLGLHFHAAASQVDGLRASIAALGPALQNALTVDLGKPGSQTVGVINQYLQQHGDIAKTFAQYGITISQIQAYLANPGANTFGTPLGKLIAASRGEVAGTVPNKQIAAAAAALQDLLALYQQVVGTSTAINKINANAPKPKKHAGSAAAVSPLAAPLGSGASAISVPTVAAVAAPAVDPLQLLADRLQVKLNAQIQAAQSKLSSDISARASLASQIRGNLTGAFSLGNAFGPYGNVLPPTTFLGAGGNLLHRESSLLDRVAALHLSPEELGQIAGLPPQQAIALLTNILSKPGSIPTINREQALIDRYAARIGDRVSAATYDKQIAADTKNLRRLDGIEQLLRELVRKGITAHELVAAFNAALKGVQVHG